MTIAIGPASASGAVSGPSRCTIQKRPCASSRYNQTRTHATPAIIVSECMAHDPSFAPRCSLPRTSDDNGSRPTGKYERRAAITYRFGLPGVAEVVTWFQAGYESTVTDHVPS